MEKLLLRIYVFAAVILLLGGRASSQDTVPSEDKGVFTRFYHANGQVSSQGYMKDRQPDGIWESFDENGNLLSKGARKNLLLEGVWNFYESGKLQSEISYHHGRKNGVSKYYFPDYIEEKTYRNDTLHGWIHQYDTSGLLKKSIPYFQGIAHGLSKTYNPQGEIVVIARYDRGFIVEKEIINQRDTQGKKKGKWKVFYPNDRLFSEVSYRNDLRDGYYKEYDSLGNIRLIQKYENGVLQEDAEEVSKLEIYTEYYPNSKVKLRAGYRNGKLEGICRTYDSVTGEVIEALIFKDGEIVGGGVIDEVGNIRDAWKEYYEDGSVKVKGKYVKGKRSGHWVFYYPDGSVQQEGNFKRGLYDGEWTWYYPNGQIRNIQNFYKGELDGESTEYDEEGRVIAHGTYVEGYEEGRWFYLNGSERLEGSYSQGERNGLWKHYWQSEGKQLSFKGSYVDGLPDGLHSYYWENGNIRREEKYRMGRKVGTWRKYNEKGELEVKIKYNNREEEERYNAVRTLSKEEEKGERE